MPIPKTLSRSDNALNVAVNTVTTLNFSAQPPFLLTICNLNLWEVRIVPIILLWPVVVAMKDAITSLQVLILTQEKKLPYLIPRQQVWSEHFIWTSDGLCIIGTTPTGRATCERLDLNDERRGEKFIQKSRQRWIESGLHPPEDDPHE